MISDWEAQQRLLRPREAAALLAISERTPGICQTAVTCPVSAWGVLCGTTRAIWLPGSPRTNRQGPTGANLTINRHSAFIADYIKRRSDGKYF